LPPTLDKIRLADLLDTNGLDLGMDDLREGERFSELDLGGRALAGITFSECEFINVGLAETDLRNARFLESTLTTVNAPILRAPSSTWRDVAIGQSRIGSGELYESEWKSVHLSHCKIEYLNLRGSTIFDVLFTNCTIGDLDLGGVKASRVAFSDTTIENLDITGSSLQHFDLRGAELSSLIGVEYLRGVTVTPLQLSDLAPILARHHGVKVEV